MNWEQYCVRKFHEKYGVVINERPRLVDNRTLNLREKLIFEEMQELRSAIGKENLIEIADALADSLYVIYGTAVSYGIDLEKIFAEVHESNMTKEGYLREDGKILKGKNWKPPDILKALRNQE